MKISRLVLLVVGACALISCDRVGASCWPGLLDQQYQLRHALGGRTIDIDAASKARSDLLAELRCCSPDENFLGARPDDSELDPQLYSLLDMAIMADDARLTRKYANELPSFDWRGRDSELVFEGRYLQLAAHFESKNAIRELLALGMDPNLGSDRHGTALHDARVFTDNGLETIRELVIAGASLDAVTNSGLTPMFFAHAQGSLAKAQCLFSFGATIPDSSQLSDPSMFVSPEAMREVAEFFASTEKRVPEKVSRICSIK